jgi:hypothetical protein
MSYQGETVRGSAKAEEVERAHAEGFARALDRALDSLEDAHLGSTFEVKYQVEISKNPGGVSVYTAVLTQPGG